MGIMENRMETFIHVYIRGLYRGYTRFSLWLWKEQLAL